MVTLSHTFALRTCARSNLFQCFSVANLSAKRNLNSKAIENGEIYHKLPRIYIEQDLAASATVSLDEENTNYLHNVMRIRSGETIRVFNGRNGEFTAVLMGESGKRRKSAGSASLTIETLIRSPAVPPSSSSPSTPSLTLYFAPVKKDKLKVILEKATELGVETLCPVITQNTNVDIDSASLQRSLRSILIQSVEQCERLSVPVLQEPISWTEFLETARSRYSNYQSEMSSSAAENNKLSVLQTPLLRSNQLKLLFLCRERSHALPNVLPIAERLRQLQTQFINSDIVPNHPDKNPEVHDLAILVGPEGGFTSQEMTQFDNLASTCSGKVFQVSLGCNVLRSETATVSALAILRSWLDMLEYRQAIKPS